MRKFLFFILALTVGFVACENNNEGTGNGNGNSIKPNHVDVEFEAAYLDGYYYGQKYGEGSDRYCFLLSEKGTNNAGQVYTNSIYYYLDLFGPVADGGAPYFVAQGTYKFDATMSGAPYTFTENSRLMKTLDDSAEEPVLEYGITDGTIVVSKNHIEAVLTISDKIHYVVYNGGLMVEEIEDDNGGNEGGNEGGTDKPTDGQEKDPQSTLTEDHEMTFPDEPRAKYAYEGDWYKCGYVSYEIFVMNKYNGYVTGDTLQLNVITDSTSNDGDFFGTYECSYTPGKNIMMAGYTDNFARPCGTWYYEYGAGANGYAAFAMIVDGQATITDNNNGTITIVLDGYDYLNNHITCNWTGAIEED